MGDEASYPWKHGLPNGSQVTQEAWACENVHQQHDNRKKHGTCQDVPRGRTMTYGTEFIKMIWEDT